MMNEPIRIEKIQHPFAMTARDPAKQLVNKLEFPASPAFVNNYQMYKQPQIPYVIDVLSQKNIPFSVEE